MRAGNELMMISNEQHDAVSSILRGASNIYTSKPEDQRDKLQWERPDNWKLGDPTSLDPRIFWPDDTKGCYEANKGKWLLWSRIINVLVREKYTSILDIGTGSGVFPAFVSRTGMTPYAIEPFTDYLYTNAHWFENIDLKPEDHLFCADLNSFLTSLSIAVGERKPPFFVDCISWIGTLSGPENAEDWEKVKGEITDLIKCAPWICKSLLISGDISMGMLIEKTMNELGVDYAMTYKFGNSYHVSPSVQTSHYMFTFGEAAKGRKATFVKDEDLFESKNGIAMVRPPNEYGFWSKSAGINVHPYPSTPSALLSHGSKTWPLEPEKDD